MLVIFDCDGVLVDSEVLANRAMRAHLSALGITLSAAAVDQLFMGRSMASCLQEISRLAGRDVGQAFVDQLQADTYADFQRELQPVAGVINVLHFLDDAQIPYCVASSGTHEKMDITLNITGIRRYVEGRVFSVTEVAHGKPAPDLFLHAAAMMGVEPRHTLVVEDSLPGVQAARAAGMRVAAYAARTAADSFAGQADTVFLSMAELPTIIAQQQRAFAAQPITL